MDQLTSTSRQAVRWPWRAW